MIVSSWVAASSDGPPHTARAKIAASNGLIAFMGVTFGAAISMVMCVVLSLGAVEWPKKIIARRGAFPAEKFGHQVFARPFFAPARVRYGAMSISVMVAFALFVTKPPLRGDS